MAIKAIFLFLITVGISGIFHVSAQSSCTTPDGQAGTCLVITSCRKLNDLVLDRYRTPADTRLLRDSKCGDEGRMPKVCCDEAAQVACTTPDNAPGSCVALAACPPLEQLALGPKPLPADVLAFLRASVCRGAVKNSVCCGADKPSVATDIATKSDVVADTDVNELLPGDGECGLEEYGDKITNGEEADLGEFPWMGILMYRFAGSAQPPRYGCGSSLISRRYAITAAHCVAGRIIGELGVPTIIRLGEHNRTNPGRDCQPVVGGEICTEEPIEVGIERYLAYPEFRDIRSPPYDIGIVRLARDVAFNDYIRPICLPKSDFTQSLRAEEARMVTAGWGLTDSYNFRGSDVKMKIGLPYVNNNACEALHNANSTKKLTLTDRQICFGGEPGKDSCRGDSGGPLMSKVGGGAYNLHGVVSFGPFPCGQTAIPGVYTKVHSYLDWIRGEIKP